MNVLLLFFQIMTTSVFLCPTAQSLSDSLNIKNLPSTNMTGQHLLHVIVIPLWKDCIQALVKLQVLQMCILLSAGLVKSLFIDRFPRVGQLSVCQERHVGCTEIQARSFGRDTAPTLGRAEEALSPGSGRQWTFYTCNTLLLALL